MKVKLLLFAILILCTGCYKRNAPIRDKSDFNLYEKYNKYTQIPLKKSENKHLKEREKKLHNNFYKKISVSISSDVNISEILMEICKNAGINLALSNDILIKKSFVYIATEKTVIEFIEDICELLDLKYYVKDTTVIVEKDDPCFKTFSVSFLFATRSSKSDTNIATDMNSSADNAKSTHESQSKIESSTQIDFWKELEQNVMFILNNHNVDVKVNPDNKLCVLHKQAGLISVFGTRKQHSQIEGYLRKLKELIFTQIIIEAKIVEVELSDKYSNGIDWNLLKDIVSIPLKISLPFANSSSVMDNSDLIGMTAEVGDSSAGIVVKALQRFGSVKVTSNPRITALNNQPAILRVVVNEIAFRLRVENTSLKGSNLVNSVSSDIKTIPIGLVLKVQACVEGDNVILSINPIISRIVGFKSDPGVSLEAAKYNNSKLTSTVPIVQYEEINTIVALADGGTLIIGGLIEHSDSEYNQGLPGLKKPLLGHKTVEKKKKELVVVIKVDVDKRSVIESDE